MNAAPNRPTSQAYQQAPWRVQVQRIAFFLLGLIVIVLVAGIYLFISAKTAEVGFEIRHLEAQRKEILISIADQSGKLGNLTAVENMQKRAAELGFEPIDPNAATYMIIPEYTGRPVAAFAPSGRADALLPRPVLKPAYTQSLWDWVMGQMETLNRKSAEGTK